MRRAGLTYCANIDENRFKGLRLRGQLPFYAGDAMEAKWQEFSLKDAFDLRLMVDLLDDHGVGIATALYIAGNAINPASTPAHPLNHSRGEGDIWAGGATFLDPNHNQDGEPGEGAIWRKHFAGKLEDLHKSIQERDDFLDCEPVRIVTVNASRAAHFVRTRAMALGLPEGRDFTPIWSR